MENVRVILEAVNSGNLELARRTADAEVRKAPTSDVYLCLKVFTCFKANDRTASLETAAEAVKFCSKKTLEMFLIPALCHLNAGALLNAAFIRVNRQNPQDNDVSEAWLECALLMGDLDSAQKAVIAMQRASKNLRLTTFQACYLMSLLFQQHKNNEDHPVKDEKIINSYKLFPILAGRMLEKYLPPLNAQECFVAAKVRRMSNTRELVSFLQSNDELTDGTLDLKLMLLEGLEELAEWQQLYDYAAAQLKNIDSFNFYQAMNRASKHLGLPFTLPEKRTSGINGALAELDWCSQTGQPFNDALVKCWSMLSSKPSAFKYLRNYVNSSNISTLKSIPESIGNQLNLYKLRSQLGEPIDIQALFKLFEAHLGELPADKKDYFFGTDALLLIATHILQSQSEFYREKALIVLDYANQHDPYHFYVKLLLIKIYKSLGLHSEAMKHFGSLDIKSIQLENLGYIVSTRIATLAPQLAPALVKVLDMAASRFPNSGTYSSAALSSGAFTQFQGIFELGKLLRYSLSQALVILEKFKLSRIRRGSTNLSELHSIGECSILNDNRDWSTGFENPSSEYLSSLELGPKQDVAYVEIQKQKEICIHSLTQRHIKCDFLVSVDSLPDSLTAVEKWNICVIYAIYNKTDVAMDVPNAPDGALDWRFYHWCYTIIETTNIAKQLKFSGLDQHKLIKNLRDAVSRSQQRLSNYESVALKQIQGLNLPGNGASKIVRKILLQQQSSLKLILEAIRK